MTTELEYGEGVPAGEYGNGGLGAENGPQPPTPGGGRVESSLHGLVDELDKLRETLGYTNQLQVIEQHLQALQTENDELRSYAEEAIKEAERLANQNEELQARLRQQELDEQMGAVLAETQKLRDVADEFEKDLVLQKLAEAEERMEEVAVLQGRVRELEEENIALTQTLNEYRESTEQLQRLRMMENGALDALGYRAGAEGGTAACSARQQQPAGRPLENGSAAEPGAKRGPGSAAADSSPRSVSSGAAAAGTGSTARASTRGGGGSGSARGSGARDPLRLAEQLAAAAGGADVGVVASAAKCLRDYAALETALAHERQECERLRQEVDELRDTMFSKSFKPPSAWAEREVKYKMEKKVWEDETKELASRLAELERENAEYRTVGGAVRLEERIQELEAQLLQTERQKDDARAQLHELQISLRSISKAPEVARFSPYKVGVTVAGGDGGEGVHGVVAELERHRIGIEAPPVLGAAATVTTSGDAGQQQGRASMDSEAGAPAPSGTPPRPKSDKLKALAADRAHAEAALEEHNKRSDVAALRRSKAELETKVAMMEQQIGKMQWAIEHADQEQAALEEQLDTAIRTGDVKNLKGLREKLKAGLASPSRMFRRSGKGGGPSPNKAAMSKQLHQTTDALRSSEAEKNALRRQLAKLSRKYRAMAVVSSSTAAAGAAAAGEAGQRLSRTSLDSARSGAGAGGNEAAASGGEGAGSSDAAAAAAALAARDLSGEAAVLAAASVFESMGGEMSSDELEEFMAPVPGIDDSEMEILALREENELLMDQLVTTKVRLAETEGDFLRSKRELLRAKEKRQELEERLAQRQEAAQMGPLGAGASAIAGTLSPMPSFTTQRSYVEEAGGVGGGLQPSLSREASASSVGGAGPEAAAATAGGGSSHLKHWMGALKL